MRIYVKIDVFNKIHGVKIYCITSSIVGAGILINRHLLRIGSIILLGDLQHKMSLTFDIYNSMVLRSAA
jgi:hypothetical protein